jgi:glycogen operon protein
LPDLARVAAGCREIFEPAGRRPWASVNFVCAHDGFTLNDLVSYNERHNEANGEDNQDGHNNTHSWNCGAEGPTDDPAILALRARQKRNFLTTLMLAIGTPMLVMGDEVSRSQSGNNNAYCQDNEMSWLDWKAGAEADPDLLAFTQAVIALRRDHGAFRRRGFFTGTAAPGSHLKDVYWLAPDGREMDDATWHDGPRRALGMQIGNDGADDGRFLLLMNAGPDPVDFHLPADFPGARWRCVLDTGVPQGVPGANPLVFGAGEACKLAGRTFLVFRHETGAPQGAP